LTENIGCSSLIKCAADDKLFLDQQQFDPNLSRMNWRRLTYNLHIVDNTLEFLQSLSRKVASGTASSGSAYKLSLLRLDEKTSANLEHLLLRIRYFVQEALVSRLTELLQAEASKWRLHWKRQLKFGGEKWCSEFSSSRRPLSTTWPWSIRPSLAVIWGVCWMFYPQRGGEHEGKWMSWQDVLETQAAFDRERAREASQGKSWWFIFLPLLSVVRLNATFGPSSASPKIVAAYKPKLAAILQVE
jgi:hypothetical protein